MQMSKIKYNTSHINILPLTLQCIILLFFNKSQVTYKNLPYLNRTQNIPLAFLLLAKCKQTFLPSYCNHFPLIL